MFSRGDRLRPLRLTGAGAALELALSDPLPNALGGARLADLSRSPGIGQEFSIFGQDRRPLGVMWHGVNLSPISASPAALEAFGQEWSQRSRRCSSIVGERPAIEALWRHLEPSWGPGVREARWSQPLLVHRGASAGGPALSTTEDGAAAPGPGGARLALRQAVHGEEGLVLPAAVAMFREEVGADPLAHDGGRGYRSRIAHLIAQGRTYVVMREGRVLFKADVGAVLGPVAQIHGVWVDPAHRGEGIGRAAMADLARQVARDHAPQVSLYVNDFNEPARRAYAAAGFVQAGELSTILF